MAVGCSRYVASDDNDNKGVVGRGIKRVAFNKKAIGEVSLTTNSDIVVVVVCIVVVVCWRCSLVNCVFASCLCGEIENFENKKEKFALGTHRRLHFSGSQRETRTKKP